MGFSVTILLAAALALEPAAVPGAAGEPPTTLSTTLPSGTWEASLLYGARLPPAPDASFEVWGWPALAVGLGDRWQLSLLLPTLAYRFGEPEATEWVLSLGPVGFGNFRDRGATVVPATFLAFRRNLGAGRAVLVTAGGATPVEWGAAGSRAVFEAWRVAGAAGWSQTFGEWLTLTPGVTVARREAFPSGDFAVASGTSFAVGSVVGVAGRERPLVQVHLTPDLSLDGHASFAWDTGPRRWEDIVALGSTWTF